MDRTIWTAPVLGCCGAISDLHGWHFPFHTLPTRAERGPFISLHFNLQAFSRPGRAYSGFGVSFTSLHRRPVGNVSVPPQHGCLGLRTGEKNRLMKSFITKYLGVLKLQYGRVFATLAHRLHNLIESDDERQS